MVGAESQFSSKLHSVRHVIRPDANPYLLTSTLIANQQNAKPTFSLLDTIQALPLGMTLASLPLLLKAKSSFTVLGTFSIAGYPYSLKLFWSPIVDTIYIKRVGRRKTWIIPAQLLSALILYFLSESIEGMLDADPVPIHALTFTLFCVTLLAATQDIAVDGWGIDMFSEEDRHYASQCQTIGLETGFFLSYTVFLALNSPDFCNSYLRSISSPEPILTVGGALYICAIIYVLATIVIMFKHEKSIDYHVSEPSALRTYYKMWDIIRLPHVKTLACFLLVYQLGTYGVKEIVALKLTENGFPRATLASSNIVNFPLQLLAAFLFAQYVTGRSLTIWFRAYLSLLVLVVLSVCLVYFYPSTSPGPLYTATVFFYFAAVGVTNTIRFTSMNSFFAKISDPAIGGTYMTLLNTISNFGGTYPQFFFLRLVDFFTVTYCSFDKETKKISPDSFSCRGSSERERCVRGGGDCVASASPAEDGYYYVVALSLLFGLFLIPYIRSYFIPLQSRSSTSWRKHRNSNSDFSESAGLDAVALESVGLESGSYVEERNEVRLRNVDTNV